MRTVPAANSKRGEPECRRVRWQFAQWQWCMVRVFMRAYTGKAKERGGGSSTQAAALHRDLIRQTRTVPKNNDLVIPTHSDLRGRTHTFVSQPFRSHRRGLLVALRACEKGARGDRRRASNFCSEHRCPEIETACGGRLHSSEQRPGVGFIISFGYVYV
jgi:hypothetical protein